MLNNPVRGYFLEHLRGFQGRSLIERLEGVSCSVGFRVEHPDSASEYSVELVNGAITGIEEGWNEPPEIIYTTSEESFFRIVGGWLRAERAFLSRKVSIGGHLLRGLKLAFLLQEFFDRYPYRPLAADNPCAPVAPSIEEPYAFPDGLVEEQVEIPGADLAAKVVYPEEGPISHRVILVPPHPFLGGTSDNALLLRLCSALASRGAFVVRFDYSDATSREADRENGVRSFWESSEAGIRMGVEDLTIINNWLIDQAFDGDPGIAWVGYSYGAQVCLWAEEFLAPDRQVFISPVASQLGEEKRNCRRPTLLIGGGEDFATPLAEFRALKKSFPGSHTQTEIEGADHFYTGREEELVTAVVDFLNLDPILSRFSLEGSLV